MTTTLHPDRYSTTATTRKNGVVIHDSEGSEGTFANGQLASAQLVAYLRAKGDRPSPSRPGGFYGSGYHAVATEDGGYFVVGDASAAPYHAPPVNATMWSICMPGKAAQTRAQWLGDVSRQYIRGVARYVVDRWHDDRCAWPLELIDAAELVAAHADVANHPAGYTAHAEVSKAWHKTDHTDPGSSFPWDVLADDIAALTAPISPPPVETKPTTPTTPEEDDDMLRVITNAEPYNFGGTVYNPGIVKWLLTDDGRKVHLTQGYWVGVGQPAGTPIPSALIDGIPG